MSMTMCVSERGSVWPALGPCVSLGLGVHVCELEHVWLICKSCLCGPGCVLTLAPSRSTSW